MKFGSFDIIETGGWNLNNEIPKRDFDCIENNIFIPLNYGLGIKTIHNNENYHTYRHRKAIVTLEITSWKGISFGAIHYYGELKIELPEMMKDDKFGYTTSCWDIPMFNNNTIELTHVLEQWEIDKYPVNYEFYRAGNNHDGFYGKETIKMRANEIMEKIFEKGWVLKIDDCT